MIKEEKEDNEILKLIRLHEEQGEAESKHALESIFQINGVKLQTQELDKNYVFFSLSRNHMKEFINTINIFSKCTSIYTFKFMDSGLHNVDTTTSIHSNANAQEEIHWHLESHFFHTYQMERKMEIEVSIRLDEFISRLNVKNTCDIVYFVCSSAGIATWRIIRINKEFTPDFFPNIERKQDPEQLLTLINYFTDSRQTFFVFKRPSNRMFRITNKIVKEEKDKRNAHIFIQFKGMTNELIIGSSEANVSQGHFTCFQTTLLEEPIDKSLEWKGTFSANMICFFCKLCPSENFYMYLIRDTQTKQHLLKLKSYYKELSEPESSNSFFEIFLPDMSSNLSTVTPTVEVAKAETAESCKK